MLKRRETGLPTLHVHLCPQDRQEELSDWSVPRTVSGPRPTRGRTIPCERFAHLPRTLSCPLDLQGFQPLRGKAGSSPPCSPSLFFRFLCVLGHGEEEGGNPMVPTGALPRYTTVWVCAQDRTAALNTRLDRAQPHNSATGMQAAAGHRARPACHPHCSGPTQRPPSTRQHLQGLKLHPWPPDSRYVFPFFYYVL